MFDVEVQVFVSRKKYNLFYFLVGYYFNLVEIY